MSVPASPFVLILGAGVNGACVARELALNGVAVWIVDRFDIAYGATAKSSRLIHGGLRYLEYGDVALVRESLEERARLLELAPQYVRPLRLSIPVQSAVGGMMSAGLRFLKLSRTSLGGRAARLLDGPRGRGLATVRAGLWMYDQLAGGGGLPGHTVVPVGDAPPHVDPARYGWMCRYFDAQMLQPERFTLALLEDAREVAERSGADFRVLTHCAARLTPEGVVLESAKAAADRIAPPLELPSQSFRPDCVVNATGAWGDWTLRDLHAAAPQLFGGTRGSHLLTRHAGLRKAIQGEGVYAEAGDGRLVFILPCDDAVLVGTTDEPFPDRPEDARATSAELAYLIGMVNEVFPQVGLTAADIASHYSGVRPLPHVEAGSTSAIPRGHWIDSRTVHGLAVHTLIGGKLTTCRALGEQGADRVFAGLDRIREASTRTRPIPGAQGLNQDADDRRKFLDTLAAAAGFPAETVAAAVRLLGSRAEPALLRLTDPDDRQLIVGTPWPRGFVRNLLEGEWVATLGDLVERRLLLPDSGHVTRETLQELAALCGIPENARPAAIDSLRGRLKDHYGIDGAASPSGASFAAAR
ncbi:MAG: glycerol-3-phosphate dehydrogenase/oxidase [Planctomyces sp.]|nr:glycerol-3-phosphate dehydrogenase/oxidase [Planctomyces sp.]